MTTPEPVILRRWKTGLFSRTLLALFPHDPGDGTNWYYVESVDEQFGSGAADYRHVMSLTVQARLTEPDAQKFFQNLDKDFGPLRVYQRETPQMRARREWNWRQMMQMVPGTPGGV